MSKPKRECHEHRATQYTAKQKREMSKNLINLDGSAVHSDSDRAARPSSINTKEHEARWDLAFGRISQEEFNELKDSGELDE